MNTHNPKNMFKNNIFISNNFIDQVNFACRNIMSDSNNRTIYSDEIWKCSRLLVKEKLSDVKMSKKNIVKRIRNSYIKNILINSLSKNDNFTIMSNDVVFCDFSVNLTCVIDAVIRINQLPFVFLFRYLSKKEFDKTSISGALRKDVIDMNCCLFLSQFYDGMLVYYCNEPLIYHIKSSQDMHDAVVKKCRTINSFINEKQLPKMCFGFEKKECYSKCKLE